MNLNQCDNFIYNRLRLYSSGMVTSGVVSIGDPGSLLSMT